MEPSNNMYESSPVFNQNMEMMVTKQQRPPITALKTPEVGLPSQPRCLIETIAAC